MTEVESGQSEHNTQDTYIMLPGQERKISGVGTKINLHIQLFFISHNT